MSNKLITRLRRILKWLVSMPSVVPSLFVMDGFGYSADEKTRARMDVLPHPDLPMSRICDVETWAIRHYH